MILPVVGLVAFVGCSQTPTPAKPVKPESGFLFSQPDASQLETRVAFVGNAACEECHKRAFDVHRSSRHNHTLLAGDRKSLGDLAPPVGRIRGTPYSLSEVDGKLFFGLTNKPEFRQPIDVAFGSGKTGLTFASYVHTEGPDASLETEGLLRVRMSWFPHLKRWLVTPSDEKLRPNDRPSALMGNHGRTCISCHVVTLDDLAVIPQKRFFGVGCEVCHGPGSAHIAAARTKGARDLKIQRLGSLSSRKLSEICAKCHGEVPSGKTAASRQISVREAALHPPAGMSDSACFTKSAERLSCLSCHDAHGDARRDAGHYEAVCKSCHGKPPVSDTSAGARRIATGEPVAGSKSVAHVSAGPCPVEPSGHCLPCHMRSSPVFLGGGRGTDHCIRRFQPRPQEQTN